jgi:hypothetical protein
VSSLLIASFAFCAVLLAMGSARYSLLLHSARVAKPRQFFPKRMALDNVSEKEAFRATDLMNNRPRKCLGYKTPFEVFAKMTGKDYSNIEIHNFEINWKVPSH